MEAVGRLAGGIAHDFNNLLTAIGGYGEICARASWPAGDALRERRSSEIRTRGDARRRAHPPAAGLQPPAGAPAARRSTSTTWCADMAAHAAPPDRRGHRARDGAPPPTRGRVRADPGQLEQVVMNLAVNARDAMPDGGTLTHRDRATCSSTTATRVAPRASRRAAYVLLAVRDTGVGMDDGDARRASSSRSSPPRTPGKGTGLGLGDGLRHRQADAAATSAVDSAPGRGHDVQDLPARASDAAGRADAGAATAARPCGGSETVLLVEDEDAVRALVRRVLAAPATRCSRRSDGAEALRSGRAARRHDRSAAHRRRDAGDERPRARPSSCGGAHRRPRRCSCRATRDGAS